MLRGNLTQQKEFLLTLNEMEARSEYHWDMMAFYWEQRRIHCIFSVLESLVTAHSKVIDVGSGDGIILSLLEKKGIRPVGADLSFTRLKRSVAQCHAFHVQADITCLPIPDSTFDIVVCTDVVEHLLCMDKAVAELTRICREGGCVLVSVPCCNWYRLVSGKTSYISPYTHLREFSYMNVSHFERMSALVDLFAQRDFSCIRRKGTCVFSVDFYQRHDTPIVRVLDRGLSLLNVRGMHLYEILVFRRN